MAEPAYNRKKTEEKAQSEDTQSCIFQRIVIVDYNDRRCKKVYKQTNEHKCAENEIACFHYAALRVLVFFDQ